MVVVYKGVQGAGMSSTVQRVVCPCDVPGVFGRLLVRKLLKFNDVRAPIPLMNAVSELPLPPSV